MKKEERNKYSRAKGFITILVSLMIFAPFVYAFYKDYEVSTEKSSQEDNIQTNIQKQAMDTISHFRYKTEYSKWYNEGYEKGYASGEEDTNDGEYRAGYDNTNPYKDTKAAEYCEGYDHGYEDAFEEIIETSDEDGEIFTTVSLYSTLQK